VDEVGQNAVDPAEEGKHGPEGDGDRRQDDQALQKVFEQFAGERFEFHEQRFVIQK
jgi:hypothetical protein